MSARSTAQHTILASQESGIIDHAAHRHAQGTCRGAVSKNRLRRHAHARRARCMHLGAAHCIRGCGTSHTMSQGGQVIRKGTVLGGASRQCGETSQGARAYYAMPRSRGGRQSSPPRASSPQANLLACATQHGASCGVQLGRAQCGRRGSGSGGKCQGRQHPPWTHLATVLAAASAAAGQRGSRVEAAHPRSREELGRGCPSACVMEAVNHFLPPVPAPRG